MAALIHQVTANPNTRWPRPSIWFLGTIASLLIAQELAGVRGLYWLFGWMLPIACTAGAAYACWYRARDETPGNQLSRRPWLALGFTGVLLVSVVLLRNTRAANALGITTVEGWLDRYRGDVGSVVLIALIIWLSAYAARKAIRTFEIAEGIWRRRILRTAALMTCLSLLLSTTAGLLYETGSAHGPSYDLPHASQVVVPDRVYFNDVSLAKEFAPRLFFDRYEDWLPSKIAALGAKAVVVNTENSEVRLCPGDETLAAFRRLVVAGHSHGSRCARAPACRSALAQPCYEVDLSAFCTQECVAGKRASAYARVLRSRDSPGAFPEIQPSDGIPRVTAVVEYWFFYRQDQWKAATPVGVLDQHHQGDWEGMLVAFAKSTRQPARPVWVGFTEHCGGTALPWRRTRVLSGGDTHPIAYVARGSHANYSESTEQTPPDWYGCVKNRRGGVYTHFFGAIASVREHVHPALAAEPNGVVPSIALADSEPLLGSPIYWGLSDTTSLNTLLGDKRLAGPAPGPESPGCKALWREPAGNVYCDDRWDSDGILDKARRALFCLRWKPAKSLACGA